MLYAFGLSASAPSFLRPVRNGPFSTERAFIVTHRPPARKPSGNTFELPDLDDLDDDDPLDPARLPVNPWMEAAARIVLMNAGINPEDGAAVIARTEEIKRTPKLRSAAVILGLLPVEEPKGSAAMIEEAQNDPLLWKIPSPEKLNVCFQRARLTAWCMTGVVPALTPEEREAAERLHVDENPFGAAHLLLTTPLDEDPASRVNEKASPARRTELHEAAWIREFTSLIALLPGTEYAAAEAKVAALFTDGLPMTVSRLLASETLEEERRVGLVAVEETEVRKLN